MLFVCCCCFLQSMTADCMQPEWHHMKCFFEIRRPVSVDLIDGFVNLRYNHQMEIRSNLGKKNYFVSIFFSESAVYFCLMESV